MTFSASIFASVFSSIFHGKWLPKWSGETYARRPFWRPFRDLFRRSIFRCILVALWVTFCSLLAPFGSLLAPFWLPLGSLWLPSASFGTKPLLYTTLFDIFHFTWLFWFKKPPLHDFLIFFISHCHPSVTSASLPHAKNGMGSHYTPTPKGSVAKWA